MDILIEHGYREDDMKALPIEELARFVISSEGKPDNSEVSITFVDDEEMAELNARYRGKEGPTDVLSFECDNVDDGFAAPPGFEEEIYELGDIVIAVDVAERSKARSAFW